MSTPPNEPRGLRNCNPLNLRHSADRWQGAAPEQPDRSFVRFTHLRWGFRAAFRTLHTYYHRHGLRTLRALIGRWAPPEDHNDTAAYVAAVSLRAHLAATEPLPPPERAAGLWQAVVLAMTAVECGPHAATLPHVREALREGYGLYREAHGK